MMGDSQQFSLRWNNYLSHITGAFDLLRAEESLVDVTLCCEGKRIKAHKMLLSACSSYFREIFKENPCQHPVIIFRNVKFEDLQALINFMYQGEVNVAQEGLTSFLNTAELLEVQGLTGGTSREINSFTSEDLEDLVTTNDTSQGGKKPNKPSPSPCPESPPNKKKRVGPLPSTVSNPPSSSSDLIDQSNIKTEPEFFDNDSTEIYEDSISTNEIIKQEVQDRPYSGGPSEDSGEGISNLDRGPGPSADGTLHESLQEDTALLERKYACNLCGKTYKYQSNLSAHKRVHKAGLPSEAREELFTPSSSGRLFECKLCGKSYKHQSNLASHRRTSHPGINLQPPRKGRKFGCKICGKKFRHPSNLSTHKLTHTGQTSCSFCSKTLSSKMALVMHLNAIHQVKP